MTSCLLLVDYQHAVCDPKGTLASSIADQLRNRSVPEKLENSLRAARSAQLPVIHVRVVFKAGYLNRTSTAPLFDRIQEQSALLEGTPDVEFIPEAQPTDDEPVLNKRGVSALVGTGLAELLVKRGISHIYIAGVSTNLAVESSVRQAVDAGFRVTVLEDLCAAASLNAHEFSVQNVLNSLCEITTSDNFVKSITSPS